MTKIMTRSLLLSLAALFTVACQSVREDADFKVLQAQVVAQNGKADELAATVAALSETVAALKQQNEILMTSLTGVSSTDETQNAKFSRLGRKLRQLDKASKDLQAAAKAGALEQVVTMNDDGTAGKVDGIENKLRDLTAQLMRRNEALENQIKQLQEQSTVLHDDLALIVKGMPGWMKN